MEKQDLKNLLENIYHLLAEDDWWRNPQPDDAPLPPIGPPPPTPRPTLPTNPYVPTSPKPDIVPEYPWHRVPPRPNCEGVTDCFFRWVWTIKWAWDYRIQEWVLQGQGKDGAGGYWLPVNKPERDMPGVPTDTHGNPDTFHMILRGLGLARPQSHDVEM